MFLDNILLLISTVLNTYTKTKIYTFINKAKQILDEFVEFENFFE